MLQGSKSVKIKDHMEMLAPAPDFRYVGFFPGPRHGLGVLGGVVAAGAGVGAGIWHTFGPRGAIASGLVAVATTAYSMHRLRWGRTPHVAPRSVPMALVPWGLLVDHEEQPRVLRWAGITRVHIETTFGRDQATDSTLWSYVVIETPRERFTGHTPGAVPLERLTVHLDAYANEAAHSIALDLDGSQAGRGPYEPDCEPLVRAARAYVQTSSASARLGLEAAGYRRITSRCPSARTLDTLRTILRDRTDRRVDPRPFAAIVAAELGAKALVNELVALVQSPHPIVAAVAKAACQRLGVAQSRIGTLDEVAPFLMEPDLVTLQAWADPARAR
ncbi:hypothetical protein LZC95_42630 [Pendulispora brunnea]|uniref:Uncharacterized protein n=1 Tax=Pendulispora brunnea TaxID=2905690 RepID=A0ABZ2K340_9BACT